uniref:Prostacyclin synthase n=1 Tax=Phocoena sinus TaxID=42100 RepID=A0A8C9C595_PHOSS
MTILPSCLSPVLCQPLNGAFGRSRLTERRPGEPPPEGSIPWLGYALESGKDAASFLTRVKEKHCDVFTVLVGGRYATVLLDPHSHDMVVWEPRTRLDFHVYAVFLMERIFDAQLPHYSPSDEKSKMKPTLLHKELQARTEAVYANLHIAPLGDTREAGSGWHATGLLEFSYSGPLGAATWLCTVSRQRPTPGRARPMTASTQPTASRPSASSTCCSPNWHVAPCHWGIGSRCAGSKAACGSCRPQPGRPLGPTGANGWRVTCCTWRRQACRSRCRRGLRRCSSGPRRGAWVLLPLAPALPQESRGPGCCPWRAGAYSLASRAAHFADDHPPTEGFGQRACAGQRAESLRLTAAPFITREVVADLTLPVADGREFTLRCGDCLLLFPFLSPQKDPESYTDPEVFKYNRFLNLDGSEKTDFYKDGKRLKNYSMPWGAGHNQRLGRGCRRFDLELASPDVEMPESDLGRYGFGLMQPERYHGAKLGDPTALPPAPTGCRPRKALTVVWSRP